MEQTFMKERKILPLVISMSLPMVLSMLVNSFYNIIDSYFVAKVSEEAMTALSLIYPLQIIVTAVSVGMGIGMNALIAFHLGAGEKEKTDQAATLGIGISFVHGILIAILFLIGCPYFLSLFSNHPETIQLGKEYGRIVFAATPFITVGIGFEKMFQAVGRMKVSMICMSVGFVTNTLLDPLLIFGIGPFPKMGMEGAAIATAIGQILTLVAYLLFYFKTNIPVGIRWHLMRWDKKMIGRMYGIGIPATLNLALPSVLITALNGILAPFGEAYLLVLGAYYKLQTFIYLPVNGVIQGIRPIMGYNYGAGEKDRVKKVFRTALAMAAIVMLAGMALCFLMPGNLMKIFTSNEKTIQIGIQALKMISLGFFISSLSVVTSGALEALGEGMPSLYISLIRFIGVMIPAALILSHFWGAVGVWAAFPVTEVITALFSALLCERHIRSI